MTFFCRKSPGTGPSGSSRTAAEKAQIERPLYYRGRAHARIDKAAVRAIQRRGLLG